MVFELLQYLAYILDFLATTLPYVYSLIRRNTTDHDCDDNDDSNDNE